jgi:hypothetical protein
MTALATSPYSLDEYRLAVEAERAKRSLRVFMKLAWSQIDPDAFVPNWHVDCMADHLEACSRGQILRLAINVPPGFAKSLTTSVFWPCLGVDVAAEDPLAGDVAPHGPGDQRQRQVPSAAGQPVVSGPLGRVVLVQQGPEPEDPLRERQGRAPH